ncbi:DNA-processing protein DprA [Clostridium guangxiense]|uniref:DNA-processing protein DprA n=1 Tax=Clostridium guangxiense TaxID=1662055 RepID=UPI001E430B84|nr:DNA-processing protein DprA [Clostridium guangxiense]MCD2345985.1 DNA-processing protein DprA [Clostridium guangxiense]
MNDYDLWFTTINASNKEKLKLIREFKDTKEIWYRFINENKNMEKFYYDKDRINEIKQEMIKEEIKVVFYYEEDYPKILKNYDDMPFGLFYKGNIKKINSISTNVGVVGSRNCTRYGFDITKILLKDLVKQGIGIISGMAKGIDTYAHTQCLENNGFTCAVLGCGADVIYPRENKELYCKIVDKGCIISQYEPNTKPMPYNFPVRNRIISGLSDLIVVVEAGIKSGSLITANAALDQGKDVAAVPGSVFSKTSLGTNMLIKEGAHSITKSSDIFDILGLQVKYNSYDNYAEKIKFQKPEEKKLYNLITDVPMHVDDIRRLTNIDIKELYALLFEMQLKNEILCLSGNYYVKINNAFK